MADCLKVCIDRILPRDLMRLQQTKSMRNGIRRAISPIGKIWMNGSTLRVRFMGGTTSTAIKLQVNAKRRTRASIGKVGEEDLCRFTAATDARYVIDTLGPTDVVMKLFGPNRETVLITDDDSWLEPNARIAGDLIAGEYVVQIRQYSRQSGTGKYSIKVRKA